MTTLGADGKASVRLDTLPHDVLLPIFTAVIALEDSHRSVAALRLTCKALYDPATDVLLGRQVLNSSNDSLEEQTRLIQYCHTVFFWLEVRLEPFLDPEAMYYMVKRDNAWRPDVAPIWKHHYSDRVFEGAEMHVFNPISPEDPENDNAEIVQMTAPKLYSRRIAAIQFQQQWPGAFDGSLEKTIRELMPKLRQDARIICMGGLSSEEGLSDGVPRMDLCKKPWQTTIQSILRDRCGLGKTPMKFVSAR